MTNRLLDVPGRPSSPFYRHVSIATGESVVHIAGQVGTDEQGRVVDGGLAAQTERALLNVALALDAAGADDRDLVRLTVYVVGWEHAMVEQLGAGLQAARQARGWTASPPATLIGVSSLFEPEMLIEIEAVAVIGSGE